MFRYTLQCESCNRLGNHLTNTVFEKFANPLCSSAKGITLPTFRGLRGVGLIKLPAIEANLKALGGQCFGFIKASRSSETLSSLGAETAIIVHGHSEGWVMSGNPGKKVNKIPRTGAGQNVLT